VTQVGVWNLGSPRIPGFRGNHTQFIDNLVADTHFFLRECKHAVRVTTRVSGIGLESTLDKVGVWNRPLRR
jgi:hypothetical protein